MYKQVLKWGVGGMLLAWIVLTAFTPASPSLAQSGEQPAFTVTSQRAADGSATIASQEALLDAAYFTAHGELNRLVVDSTRLTLAAGETTGTYTSDPIHSPLAYTTDAVLLWGADLPEGATLQLETRLSLDAGNSWSEWVDNPTAFYPVRDNLSSGYLMWVGSETATFQFRATLSGPAAALKQVIIVFNDTSQGPTDGQIAGQMARVNGASAHTCAVEKPAIVSRTQWGCPDGQNSPYRPPSYQPVTHVILHHTVTPNHTAPYQDWAGWVRSVWNYHAKVLWWGDVGYNYLIDPNGVIYEGRAGGDDVIGIHDGHNRGSLAIGFLGCYGNCNSYYIQPTDPSQTMLDSAADLIAWKFKQGDIDPQSSGPYAGKSSVPVIAGGRDVSWTSSPGDNLYNRLPELRTAVAEKVSCNSNPLQACQITDIAFDQPEYLTDQTIDLTAKVVDHTGNPLSGAEVTADVEISEIKAQASHSFNLIDRTGDYDGSYNHTSMPGSYLFKVTASDPTGERFVTCSLEDAVEVKAKPKPDDPCNIKLTSDQAQYELNEAITVTAEVTVGDVVQHTATVTGTLTRPNNTSPEPLGFSAFPHQTTYTDTSMAGNYNFAVFATGDNFKACTAELSVPVEDPPSSGTVVKVEPEHLVAPLCSFEESVAVNIENVSGLRAVELELQYDPAVVQVIDANPHQRGVQIKPDGAFLSNPSFVAKNEVDTAHGRISFAATLLGSDSIEGNAGLVIIDWRPQNPGQAHIELTEVILVGADGQPISHSVENGLVEITPGCLSQTTGQVKLQGRHDHSGIIVTSTDGSQTHTDANGNFSIANSDMLRFEFPRYLSAQANVQVQLAGNEPDGLVTNLGTLTLVVGDVNADNVIDILDLAYLAMYYQSSETTADLNADGVVDIIDLALAANNYNLQGPLTNWQ